MSVTALRITQRVLGLSSRVTQCTASRLHDYFQHQHNWGPSGARRSFVASRPAFLAAAAAQRPSPASAHSVLDIAVRPSVEDLAQRELDVAVLERQDVRLQITESAAQQLRHIAAREQNPDLALRIVVESGGCHGYQYKMELATARESDDYCLTHPTLKPSNVLVDAVSMSLLNGSTIDFAVELIGSSFRVLDNPHAQGSGCGCGISWDLKIDADR